MEQVEIKMVHNMANNKELIETAWEKASQNIAAIVARGADKFYKSTPEWPKMFSPSAASTCACIDERVVGEKFGLPGSGIVLGKEKAAALIKNQGLKKISSHKYCGAAKIAFVKNFPYEALTPELIDAYADKWTRALAADLNLDYLGQQPVEGGDQHLAEVIYYDSTGKFNPSALPDLPSGFLVTRFNTSPEETRSGLSLAAAISTGDHGFGDRFTPDTPLVIIPVGEEATLPVLQREIEAELAQMLATGNARLDSGISMPVARSSV